MQKTINVSMTEDDLAAIEEARKITCHNRSSFIRYATKLLIEQVSTGEKNE